MIRLSLILLTLASFLSACDTTTNDRVTGSGTTGSDIDNEAVSKSLDLKVTQEMIDRLVSDKTSSNQTDMKIAVPVIIEPENNKSESRVGISGEVFYDETSNDYLETIDGGKINVEIKFK